eukprot:TRINITY_DN8391_c0_g9_i1.p3 TRINITY_DN8391_c0_g9~~TRINITY_DN8391_c0_g9_i1.p3  ORF type:complete len:146 (+),score=30.65 TRINITY_DN8391_c0_g9_i1:780-1217(+)
MSCVLGGRHNAGIIPVWLDTMQELTCKSFKEVKECYEELMKMQEENELTNSRALTEKILNIDRGVIEKQDNIKAIISAKFSLLRKKYGPVEILLKEDYEFECDENANQRREMRQITDFENNAKSLLLKVGNGYENKGEALDFAKC